MLDRKSDSDVWIQPSSSVGSSTSSQEHLDPCSKSGTPASTLTKSGPGRWKTPASAQPLPAAPPPAQTDLPPPPPPPPAHYAGDFDGIPVDLPLPPPPSGQAAAERRKREEQQRWYEKEKARLEEERDRKRREQERKLGQMRSQALNPAAFSPVTVAHTKPEKPSTLQRPQDTVIRELQPQQQPRTIERRDLQYITVSKEELSSGDSLSPDPWKRDAREKLEKQQQMHIVDMLSREIRELQSKPERSAEDSDRLRKLMLEWQFQKRLQESKQKDEDDEEEEDDDVDTMLIMQRLEAERRARVKGKSAVGARFCATCPERVALPARGPGGLRGAPGLWPVACRSVSRSLAVPHDEPGWEACSLQRAHCHPSGTLLFKSADSHLSFSLALQLRKQARNRFVRSQLKASPGVGRIFS